MEFQDRMLKCIDCGSDFVFTAGEQLFFHDKQFRNEPKRCKACKTRRVSVLGAAPQRPAFQGHTAGHNKVETHAVCSQLPANPGQTGFLPGLFPRQKTRCQRLSLDQIPS